MKPMQPINQWISLDIQVNSGIREIVMDYALALGGTAIIEKNQKFEVSYPLKDETQTVIQELRRFIDTLDPQANLIEFTVNRENWNKNWQAFFKPTEINPEIIILPEWETPEAFPHTIKIRIKPAMAFGTGTHETTQLCLEYLNQIISGGERMIDLGTGSGILGISALKLGVSHVDAVDNDPVIEENILENLALNNINSGFDLQITEEPGFQSSVDILVANMLRAHLFPLLPEYLAYVKPGGQVILSGLLKEEKHELEIALQDTPWQIKHTKTKNEWIACLCEINL